MQTLCLSGEEMIVGMEKVNNLDGIRKLVAMSMDVDKMYPSLKADKVAKVVANEYRMSKLRIEVDAKALGLYLAIVVGRKELIRVGRGEVTHRRKKGEGPWQRSTCCGGAGPS